MKKLVTESRTVRGGSRWVNLETGQHVIVCVARSYLADPEDPDGRRDSWVAFVAADNLQAGGFVHQSDFVEQYSWVAGRSDPALWRAKPKS